MARRTPAARALVGVLALRSDATTNQAFRLAGYTLTPAFPDAMPGTGRAGVRIVTRRGRKVTTTSSARDASFWLDRLGRKLEALGAGKAAA
jgi:hypothetical protein